VSNSPKPTNRSAHDFPKTSTSVTSDGAPHVVTVLVHRSSDSLPKMEANEDLADANVVKCHKKLASKGSDQNSGHLPEVEYQSLSGCRARNQTGLQIPDSGKLRGVGPHCRSEASRVNGQCDDEGVDVNTILSNELAASRLEIERLTSKLKQYEVWYLHCILYNVLHFYSASYSMSLSEALPTTAIDTVSEFTRRSATGN